MNAVVQDSRRASLAPKLYKTAARVDWTRSAQEIERLHRGIHHQVCLSFLTAGSLADDGFAVPTLDNAARSYQRHEYPRSAHSSFPRNSLDAQERPERLDAPWTDAIRPHDQITAHSLRARGIAN